jgi:hypothetical protein
MDQMRQVLVCDIKNITSATTRPPATSVSMLSRASSGNRQHSMALEAHDTLTAKEASFTLAAASDHELRHVELSHQYLGLLDSGCL